MSSARFEKGFRDLASQLRKSEVSRTDTFYFVGPSTGEAIKEVTKEDYSISVNTFDSYKDILVTHTAYIKSGSKEIKIGLRYDPTDNYFHIAGYYNVR